MIRSTMILQRWNSRSRIQRLKSEKSTSDYVKLQELSDRKTALEQQLEEKMERWLYLNDLAERIAASR